MSATRVEAGRRKAIEATEVTQQPNHRGDFKRLESLKGQKGQKANGKGRKRSVYSGRVPLSTVEISKHFHETIVWYNRLFRDQKTEWTMWGKEAISFLCTKLYTWVFFYKHHWFWLSLGKMLKSGLEIGPGFGKWTKCICRKLSFELEFYSIVQILN